ncbi:RNA polymerase sigma factor [Staphylococcus phage Twort]|uniref:RNA polymerase sigma factor n=2 Tax=Staphylococcus phage Twort (strain DSM 17442 / HER 48) TaxID=2908167 RepID=A0A6H0X5H5_BPTWO|nr:RNA polymerase sigma factor [Staphylococcus phage Twort]AAX92353.1 ORF058 [Staphylococcus phage Twort]QIW89153.1 RNA polymerase sigma factor [Staphylococcus phage Twort]
MNRYVVDPSMNDLERDVDTLLYKYKNLRWSLYHRYAGVLSNESERQELQEYIDEQFIKLVKEYNIRSGVDFPGYIKSKLTLRVRNSYVKKNKKYKKTELLGNKDNTVEMLSEQLVSGVNESDVISYVFEGVEFNDIQKLLLYYLLDDGYHEDSAIIRLVSEELAVQRKEVSKELEELRTYIKFKIDAYHENFTKNLMEHGKVNTENTTWEL